MKYVLSIGAIVIIVAGYFLLAPGPSDVVLPDDPIAIGQADRSLEDFVAQKRANLPTALSDTITLTDVVLFAQMRIVEYVYVSAAPNVENLQTFIEGRAETLCLEVQDLPGNGVTLRNSFEDIGGSVLRRIYLLDEDCQRFY